MKKIFVMFALLLGVVAVKAQTTDTVQYVAGNNLYQGITRKLPYRQMVTPYGVEVTFAKNGTYHFSVCRTLRGFGKQPYHSRKSGRGRKCYPGESYDRGLSG